MSIWFYDLTKQCVLCFESPIITHWLHCGVWLVKLMAFAPPVQDQQESLETQEKALNDLPFLVFVRLLCSGWQLSLSYIGPAIFCRFENSAIGLSGCSFSSIWNEALKIYDGFSFITPEAETDSFATIGSLSITIPIQFLKKIFWTLLASFPFEEFWVIHNTYPSAGEARSKHAANSILFGRLWRYTCQTVPRPEQTRQQHITPRTSAALQR